MKDSRIELFKRRVLEGLRDHERSLDRRVVQLQDRPIESATDHVAVLAQIAANMPQDAALSQQVAESVGLNGADFSRLVLLRLHRLFSQEPWFKSLSSGASGVVQLFESLAEHPSANAELERMSRDLEARLACSDNVSPDRGLSIQLGRGFLLERSGVDVANARLQLVVDDGRAVLRHESGEILPLDTLSAAELKRLAELLRTYAMSNDPLLLRVRELPVAPYDVKLMLDHTEAALGKKVEQANERIQLALDALKAVPSGWKRLGPVNDRFKPIPRSERTA